MSLYSHLCMAINVVLEDIYIWVVEIQEGYFFLHDSRVSIILSPPRSNESTYVGLLF